MAAPRFPADHRPSGQVVAIAGRLAAAGCVAAEEEAAELVEAAIRSGTDVETLVRRRTTGEPLAWITGSVRFCGRDLRIDPGVYVPRWQSEPLARRAAELLRRGGVAVDLCTGAGALARTLAAAVPSARVVATEIDATAARCARRNGVEVYEGDLFEPLPRDLVGRVDLVVAVPPYVPTEELHLLPRDTRKFEGTLALDGGPGGLRVLTAIATGASTWLRPGGVLGVELGGDQARSLRPVLVAAGFYAVEILTDEDGDDRGLLASLAHAARAGAPPGGSAHPEDWCPPAHDPRDLV